MSEISVEEALESFGLSEKEVKIYLACIELGTSTANDIANKADLNRSTTYDLLKSFLEKGIASKVIKNNATHFEVVGPERLISLLEEKKKKILSVSKQLKLLQQSTVTKPVVELFEGGEGVKAILQDIISTKKPLSSISTSKIFEMMVYYFPQYIKNRKDANISARVIQEASSQTEELKKKDKDEKRETRSIKNFNLSSTIFIYGEKVAIIKLIKNELISVLISDPVLAEDHRKIFERLWKEAK
ncbi:MAG: helix-turn-helix domain-containing protein [Candidatus Woesearchaeota archaeon]